MPDAFVAMDLPPVVPDLPTSTCGNGQVDPGEDCDDGNTIYGDGCSALCQVESYWIPGCPDGGCLHVCGDATVNPGEVCDDGNTTSGDGCSADCKSIEDGWRCPRIGWPCSPICGDGLLRGGETCEDGNTTSGDGCAADCHTEIVGNPFTTISAGGGHTCGIRADGSVSCWHSRLPWANILRFSGHPTPGGCQMRWPFIRGGATMTVCGRLSGRC